MVMKTRSACASTSPVSSTCACIQTENLSMDASTQVLVWSCCICGLQFTLSDLQAGGDNHCERCLLVESLRQQVGELQEEVARLRSIRSHEEFLDSIPVESTEVTVVGCGTVDQPLMEEAVVQAGEKESSPTVEETRPCTTKVEQSPATTARRKRRVVVVGDSLLRGTEAPICRPDSSSREVCCLPGARIRDVTEALSRIIRPSDYYPMLLIHVGTNDTARCDTERIKCGYRALGVRVKEFGAQVVFSSILPVKGRGPGRERCILEVNAWLRRWCRQEGFGFLDHGVLFQEGLLGGDGVHLSRSGKALFGHRLANLVRRALN
ncbi:uncharacterized protein LOC142818831 isoform X1 [Pelodiscus sinensis]|uniref:uncharacterized protein LOC142818831 isoform X1 n=1 Tax=Pelodiscus sinensis TaxID=13735 RepID=UPI003F6D4753